MRIRDLSSDVCSSDRGAGLDVRVIFGEVDLAEIERLKLLRRKATAHRLLRGAPEIAVERLELGTALLLDDPAKLGVEAALAMCLLKANTEEGGRAVAADEMAHARNVEQTGRASVRENVGTDG